LEEIGKQNWEYAHRLFQCVAAASRPLRVEELAEFLAFDFDTDSTPAFREDWREEDPAHAVRSTCSSLLAIVDVDGSSVIQFAHFSVKEYLTSKRLSESKDTISRFYVSMTLAHTVIAQASLRVLLHIDETITKDGLEKFPLAEYAAKHWVGHARFEGVSPKIPDGMKCLFDPGNHHLSVWVWIKDPIFGSPKPRSECPPQVGMTPLFYAAGCGLHDIVQWLIVERSQDVDDSGIEDHSPLFNASEYGHSDAVRVLLEHDANPNIWDEDDLTPLMWASQGGYVDVVLLLLDHGAEIEDCGFYSALQFASMWGKVAVVRVLLENGADVNAGGYDGESPLHVANNGEVARVLLECGAYLDARDDTDRTPLHVTTSFGCVEAAQVLLENGADPNARDKSNQTPLHDRRNWLSAEAAQVLLEYGADPNARDSNNRTPLHSASEKRLTEVGVAQVLLENGADPNARDANNRTPLHVASEMGHLDTVRLLLRHSADVHARDDEGRTPFQLAAEPDPKVDGSHQDVVHLLLEHGAEDYRMQ
jgi:ankyrin repeat protein